MLGYGTFFIIFFGAKEIIKKRKKFVWGQWKITKKKKERKKTIKRKNG